MPPPRGASRIRRELRVPRDAASRSTPEPPLRDEEGTLAEHPPSPRRGEVMANLITVARTLLAFLAVAMLRWHTWEIYVAAALLTLLLVWMDAWDGWVARRRNEASKAGAVFDILGDRVVEMTYWIAFASFGWIPVWVAVLVSARGIIVDGFRALAFERGLAAFGASSMMRSRLGALLVSSRFS